jgi:UDP-2,4-diacetamido-2,4,6-trideoxy-beta-L-altropyranose hydrolase
MNGVRVMLRTVGSETIGLGHVRRSLALADAVRTLGGEPAFTVVGERRAADLIRVAGFEATLLDADADVLASAARRAGARVVVVDDYAVSGAELSRLAAEFLVAVVDDLADRELDVHLVVNGSAGAASLRYRCGAQTQMLLGPRFIPLRSEFAEAPARTIQASPQRLLLTLGGGDPDGVTERLLPAACRAVPGAAVDVIVGPLTTRVDGLREVAGAQSNDVVLHESPKDVRALMLAADVAISGGGQTVYELAATATPTVAIRLADNQTLNLRNLQTEGTLLWAGDAADADLEMMLTSAVMVLAGNRGRRSEMSRRSRALVDGRGAARVAATILDAAVR